MNLADLFIAKKLAGGGGGGTGTDNYNDLSNKPQINSTSLTGDKSAADLGLQSEINGDNKISADYVDDSTATNKFVTSSEKLTWGGKQDKIDADHKLSSDLVDDTNKTNKFVTSTEKSTWNGKQNAIDSSHKLSSDLVDDTNHTNKFVTSSEKETWNGKQDALTFDNTPTSGSNNPVKSGGIYTELAGKVNTSDIIPSSQGIPASPTDITVPSMKLVADTYVPNSSLVEVVDNGAKNLLNVAENSVTASAAGFVVPETEIELEANKTYVISYSATATARSNFVAYSAIPTSASNKVVDVVIEAASSVVGQNSIEFTPSANVKVCKLYVQNFTGSVTFSNFMICTKSQFGISPAYEPYALGNQILTPELIELCDSGAKNLLKRTASGSSWTDDNVTFTLNSDGSITINSTGTITESRFFSYFSGRMSALVNTAGNYVLFASASPNAQAEVWWYYTDDWTNVIATTGNASRYISTSDLNRPVVVRIRALTGAAMSNVKISPMICTKAAWNVSHKYVPYRPNWDLVSSVSPFYSVPINHNMIYRGQNLGSSLTDAQHTALSSGNFTDLFLGDYWTKTVTIPAGTYTGGDGEEVTVPAQTNITLKAVIADFDTFYAGYASSYAGINTHHAAVIVTGFSNVVWNKTNSTAGGYVASLIHKWLVGSALPQIETWFGSAKVLSHQKLLTNAITGDAASGWAWSSQKISLLSECQLYGMKVWGGSKATNGAYEPGEAFKKLDVFNHIDANLLFGNKNIWCRDIASAGWAAYLLDGGRASNLYASTTWIAPAALILLS